MTEFIILPNKEDIKQRLDKFLVTKLALVKPVISRSYIKSLIKDGKIINCQTQNSQNSQSYRTPITNCSYNIKGGEELLIIIPPPQSLEIIPKDITLDIVWEDENMMVINKQAGLTTHPGNGNYQDTLVNALLFYLGDNLSEINGILRPGIVHRLDKDTSGLMVVAKNNTAHKKLAEQIENRIFKRNYLAICFGLPKPLSGIIDKNIGRSKINRLKMITMKEGGKKAITNYLVKKLYCNSLLSLVQCQLDTGRTHQIRVHMTAVGHSLIGDKTYGNRRKALSSFDNNLKSFINNFPRQALHSYKIAFLHPISTKEMHFEVEMPEDMKELDQRLSYYKS